MKFCIIFVTATLLMQSSLAAITDDTLKIFVETANKNLAELYNKEILANYRLEVYEHLENLNESENATIAVIKYVKILSNEIKNYDIATIQDEYLKREILRLPKVGYEVLDGNDLQQLQEAILKMNEIYKNVKLCSFREPTKCDLALIPDIQDILHSSNDVKEIEFYWEQWRIKTGSSVKEAFNKFMELYRKTALLNNFRKFSDMWYNNFDQENVINSLDSIMTKIRPLFIQFHARIRFLLRQKYGTELIKLSWPLPQHLSEIFIGEAYRYDDGEGTIDFPYPEKGLPNITEILIIKEYTPKKFFDLASKFFPSIGMEEITETFWLENALPIAHPERNILNCWNKAWHFYGNEEIKLSYCRNVDFRQFLNMYEVLSDVQYYRLFREQPTIFQDEPLPNFSDAIGRVISMSVSTPKYLEKIGLIPKGTYDLERRINRLYLDGMQKVFLLPILFILDKYRVQILERDISVWDNCAYWELTEKYTGAIAPIKRSINDFDAPSKLLVGIDDEYSSQVISIILQFQVYKSLCEKVGEYKKGDVNYPLDNCDLSDHLEIGEILKKAMKLGASKSWREVLKVLTGETDLDPTGFLEYFQPLLNWLYANNLKNEVEIGWIESKQCE